MKADNQELQAEIEELRIRLEEAEETLSAIRSGEVDALVVSSDEGNRVFTMEGADQPYRVLVDTMSEGAATLKSDGTVLYCNSRLADLLGTPLEQVIGKPLLSHVAPGDVQAFNALLQRALNGNYQERESFRAELTLLRGNGDSVPALFSCCHLNLASSRGISIIITDLSEQKRNEEIAEAGELASSILQQAGETIIVCDQSGRVIRASRQSHELFGTNPMFWTFDQLGLLRESRTSRPFSISATLRGQVLTSLEVVLQRESQDFHLLLNARPLFRKQKILGCVVTLTDITDRKRAEEELRQSEERYRTLFESIDEGFCVVQVLFDERNLPSDFRFLEVNPIFEQQTGLSKAVGRTMRELVPQMDEFWFEVYGKVALTGETARFEKHVPEIDRWFDSFATRVGDPEERKVAVLLRDISDRKVSEKALEQAKAAADEASRAKSEFLANMSHEIRTPMTVFMAALEHLLQIDRNPDRLRLLQMADQSSQRLRSLIDEILDFSRIEARQVEIEEEPFDLLGCVQSTVEMMRLKAREKDLPLNLQLSPTLPHLVLGDPDRLGQILFNLIGNAIKFTHQGSVEVSVRARENRLEFTVSDTGVGIPAEKRDLIFQSFSQADSSFARKFGGSGLGLAISKGLVQLMGGEIGVRSRDGRGSVFYFTLPLKPIAEQSPETDEDQKEPEATESQGARILIAEDEPMIRDLIVAALNRGGWLAETAENGLEAVRMWEQGGFDLVLMDLQMPELSGLEATRLIREKEDGHHACIVGLTAHARREVKEECLAAGMDRVLTKPVQIKELLSIIESCIAHRKKGL